MRISERGGGGVLFPPLKGNKALYLYEVSLGVPQKCGCVGGGGGGGA